MCAIKADNFCDVCKKEYVNGLLNWEYELERSSLYCNKCYKLYLEKIIRAHDSDDFKKEKAEVKLDNLNKWMEEIDKY
jgi:hypothetical protein